MDTVNSEVVYTKLTEMETRLQARIDRAMDEVKQFVRDTSRELADMRSATASRREHDELEQRVLQLSADLEAHKKDGHPETNNRLSNLEGAGPRRFTMTTTLFFILFGAVSAFNTLINLVVLLHGK